MAEKFEATLDPQIENRLRALRKAAGSLRQSPTQNRNQVLIRVSELLNKNQSAILRANQIDLQNLKSEANRAFRDRLTLNAERIKQMQTSLQDVAAHADPIGEVEEQKRLPNGLLLKRVRSSLGVILMIFESRPNVITEAFSLAFKSGNALILRGGSESMTTAKVIYQLITRALNESGFSADGFWGVDDPSRSLSQTLMRQNQLIDVLVPRGGDSLIHYVTQNATIPIIKNDRGMCHVYAHHDADQKMVLDIVKNAKTQRPGVCNSMETLLLHRSKTNWLPAIYDELKFAATEWFADPESMAILKGRPDVHAATPQNFDTEYLDYKINVKIVSSLNEALEHIELHGSRHSECIITASEADARKFQNTVDAAATYWNASTRFTDGFEFGLGGELGISTQKLHVRGPVGLRELTSLRWIIDGQGQIR